ncbi:MAG: SBBP repeat-containing protein [Caldilinea sp.]
MYTIRPNQQSYTHRRHFALLAGMLLAASIVSHIPEILSMLRLAPANTAVRQAASPSSAEQPNLPLSFIPNVGQSAYDAQMEARVDGGILHFSATEVTLSATNTEHQVPLFSVKFIDANKNGQIHGVDKLPGVFNFYPGEDPAAWRTDVPTYADVRYAELYPGTALVYNGDATRIKGAYTLSAGADPTRIRWRYDGAQAARLDATSGDLHIQLDSGVIVEHAPVAWQIIGDRQYFVDVRFRKVGHGVFGFAVGEYDPHHELVIDPDLVFSTMLGGSGAEYGRGIALDPQGNIYVAGTTFSLDFPGTSGQTQAGSSDIFVSKLNADATQLLY